MSTRRTKWSELWTKHEEDALAIAEAIQKPRKLVIDDVSIEKLTGKRVRKAALRLAMSHATGANGWGFHFIAALP